MRLRIDGKKEKLVVGRIGLFLFAHLIRQLVRRTLVRYRTRRSRHGKFIQPARCPVLLNSLKNPAA